MFTRDLMFDLTSDIRHYKTANVLIAQSRKYSVYIARVGYSHLKDAVTTKCYSSEKSLPGHKVNIFLREFCFQHRLGDIKPNVSAFFVSWLRTEELGTDGRK